MLTDDAEAAAEEVQSSLRVSVPPGLRELIEATASHTPLAVDAAPTASTTAMQATAPSEDEPTDATHSAAFIGPRAPPSSPHSTSRRVTNGADAEKGGMDLAPPAEDDTNAAATATAAPALPTSNDSNPLATAVSAAVKGGFSTPTKPAARSEPGLVIGRRGPPAQ